MSRRRAAAVLLSSLALTGCSSAGPATAPEPSLTVPTAAPAPPMTPVTQPASLRPRPSSTTAPAPTRPPPSVAEPTTTNTLPPPPEPSRAAPSTAGRLTASALPVPAGWRTIARAGGSEEGYQGNGTWVHARDPRYAAHDVITLGCAEVSRDDYTDPTHALEGTYAKGKRAGIGLVLQFARPSQARAFFHLYVKQVAACRTTDSPLQAKILTSAPGLIDQRTYPDGDWTEVAAVNNTRLTLVILADPGHHVTKAQSQALLHQIVS